MILIPLDRIQDSPFQTRQHYDEASIESLADSIERGGLDQVPKARLLDSDSLAASHMYPSLSVDGWPEYSGGLRVQLAFGHRRLRAFRLIAERRAGDLVTSADGIGPDKIPLGYMPVELAPLTDEQMFAKAVGENAQRRDLSAVEEAEAMHTAAETFGWTHETIGERWGLSRSAVSNKLRLLKLPDSVRQMNLDGRLSESKARALVAMFVCREEHAEMLTHYAAIDFVVDPGWILQQAVECESAEKLRGYVESYVADVERKARYREAERKRIEEPELFVGESEDAEHSVPNDISAEIERINDAHNKAILWIKDPSYIRPADDDVLEKTLWKLKPLQRQARALIEQASEEEVLDVGRDLDRIASGIAYDIDRCQREIDSRSDRKPKMKMEPRPEPEDRERSVPLGPSPEEEAEMEREWKRLDSALYQLAASIPEAVRPVLSNLVAMGPLPEAASDPWASAFASAVVLQMDTAFGQGEAREAAEAWGVEVEWPESDVSAETSTDDPEEEKPLTDGEQSLLAAMAADYEATQDKGHLLAMTTNWDAGQSLVERGLAQHVANRFGRVDKARLTLTKEGTDLGLQLLQETDAAAVAEGVPA
jgi:ParB-like chromosome segregation protein Spo0J